MPQPPMPDTVILVGQQAGAFLRSEEIRGNCHGDLASRCRRLDRGVGSGEGVSPSLVGEGSGERAVPPPQKIFVILHFKWCIFMQFGVGIFTLKGV